MTVVVALCVMLSVVIGRLDAHVVKRSVDVTVASLQVLVQQQGAAIQQQGAAIQELQSRLAVCETSAASLTSLQSKVDHKVAFTAHYAARHVANVGVHGILKFDNVITNIAQGYDPQTGIFTAPVAGLYIFFVQLMGEYDTMGGYNRGIVEAILDKHGSELLKIWMTNNSDGQQGSVMTTTHMDAGEKVWARHYNGSIQAIQGYLSYFSGALLQAD